MNTTNAPRMIISTLLKPAHIELHLRANQRDGVLEELVSHIPELAGRPDQQKILLRALQEREQLCSTGVGDGVAFPHSRNALVGLVDHPILILGRHEAGIPFGSIDGNPTRLFFLLVAPTVSLHLQILARLSRLVRDPKVRQNLLAADRPERAMTVVRDAEAVL